MGSNSLTSDYKFDALTPEQSRQRNIVVQNHNILSNQTSRLPSLMLGTRSYIGKKKVASRTLHGSSEEGLMAQGCNV